MTEIGNVRWFSENTKDVPPAGANDDCQLSTVNCQLSTSKSDLTLNAKSLLADITF